MAFDTQLDARKEAEFAAWKARYAPDDSGEDYDWRGAYLAGATPAPDGHWPDTWKKPNHPTFSTESIYAKERPDLAGRWEGSTYVPAALPKTVSEVVSTPGYARLTPAERASERSRLFRIAYEGTPALKTAYDRADAQGRQKLADDFKRRLAERFPEQFTVPGWQPVESRGLLTWEPVQVPISDSATEAVLQQIAPVRGADGRLRANPRQQAVVDELLREADPAERQSIATLLAMRLGPLAAGQVAPPADLIQRPAAKAEQRIAAPAPQDSTLPVALRVAGPMGAVALTNPATALGAAAVAAGGALAAEAAAQPLEKKLGQRLAYSPAEAAVNVAFAGIPAARLTRFASPAGRLLVRATEGAAIGAGQTAATLAVRGQDLEPGTIATGGAAGGVFGSLFGAFEASVRAGQLRTMAQLARERGYAGGDNAAELRRWWEGFRAESARPVTPAAAPARPQIDAGGSPATTPAAPAGPEAPPAGGVSRAQQEFERLAGMTPPEAAPAQAVPAAPAAAGPAATSPETTAPAVAVTQPPAPGAETPSGSAAGDRLPGDAAGSAGGQAEVSTPATAPVVKPKGKGSFVSLANFPTPADGTPDLLNVLADLGGVPAPGRKAGAEYDGYAAAFSQGAARLLRRGRSGSGPGGIDRFLLQLEGLGYRFDTIDEFYEAVSQATQRRLQAAAAMKKVEYEGRLAAALYENKGRKPQLSAKAPISSDDLRYGDTLRIRGERFTVEDIDADTGAVILKSGGARLEVAAGTPIYPDRGEVQRAPAPTGGPDEAFDMRLREPSTPWQGGLTASNRYRVLSEKSIAGTATPAERAELERFEAQAGQAYVPGSMNADALAGDRASTAAAELARERMRIRAQAEARLHGGSLETQGEMFGDPGQTGLLFEPSEAELLPFMDRTELPPAERPAFSRSVSRALNRIAQLELALPYETGPLPRRGGDPVARSASPMAEAAKWLADPVAHAGPLAAALRAHGRISSIVADYFAGQLPGWNPVGKMVATPQDVAAIMAPLRSPYAESYKAILVDETGRIVHAEVLHIGALTSVAADVNAVIRMVARAAAKAKTRRVIVSHNHPSGNPTPSTADQHVNRIMRDALDDAGIALVDDVVTNGHAVYSFARGDIVELDHEYVAPWELVPRAKLRAVQSPSDAVQIAGSLRQSNPEGVFAVWLNNWSRIAGIEQIPFDVPMQGMVRQLVTGAGREGANRLVLGAGYFDQGMINEISRSLERIGVRLVDVSTDEAASWAVSGRLPNSYAYLPAAADTVQVRESEAEFGQFDPRAPFMFSSKGAYVKVPLARLDDIPIVQMPELVRLTRELTGQVPQIRKLRKALGQFRGGLTATVGLDPRIFRDSSVAAKVLAHEIGHLIDYLPQGTLKRGNLLGRLASLRQFLANTMPLNPGGTAALTPADRRALRRAAERAVGPKPADEEDAWREQVAIKYAELLQDELEARGLIVNRGSERGGTSMVGISRSGTGIREELIGLSEYWKPIPEGAPDSYVAYRHSSEELYADALSVLFNSPATLKAMAPTFFEAFFNYLDRKPEVKASLMELWEFLNKPHLQGLLLQRSEDIQRMFIKGDELLLRKAEERAARYASMRGWWDRFRQELFDVFDPLVKRGDAIERQGGRIPDKINPRYLFDEHPLADNANYRMVQQLWEKVVKPVEADGFTLNELGEYLFLQRVLNERFDVEPGAIGGGRSQVANPLGITPEAARLGLLRMRLESGSLKNDGWQRFARLEAAADKFHDIVFERIKEAVDVGAYSQRTFAERIEPNRRFYAAFAVLDYLQDYVPASIRMSQGTFKEIANPFTATVLKMVSLNRLIQTQKSKRGAVGFLERYDPTSIEPAPVRFDGVRQVVEPPKDRDKALLELLKDGKPAGYYVDPAVAEMFEKLTPSFLSTVTTVMDRAFRKLVYPLIIKYNPAFQLVLGPARDLRRSLVNVPRGRGFQLVGEFVRNYLTFLGLPPTEAAAAVRAYLRGEPHPLIAEMIAKQAIGTPLDNFARDLGRSDAMEKILRDYGLLPADKQRAAWREIAKPITWLLERIEFAGLTFEMLPKVAAYKLLTRDLGWSPREAAYFARNNVGVPNIYRKGRHTMVAEAVLPFFKVFANGLRADMQLATRPRTAGGWWARWAATDGAWTLLQAAAALGLLGAGIKELYDGISEYNKTNYNVLPLGTQEGGEFGKRVMYVRLPRDEAQRFLSGLLYQAVMTVAGEGSKPGAANVLNFGADQLPGLNPFGELVLGWTDYLEGENPKDSFRGRGVLTNAEWLAGGWPAMQGMLGWSAEQVGLTNFVRWDPTAATTKEMALSAVPGINRFLQTTDAGYRERQAQLQQDDARARARLRLALPKNVQELLTEYYYLRGIKADLRTIEQTHRLLELQSWQSRIYSDYEDAFSVQAGKPDKTMLSDLEAASRAFERSR